MSFQNRTGTALKDLLEAKGEDGAQVVISKAIESKKLRAEDFSLKEIWEACTNGANVHEAIASSAFPKITGALINSKLIEGYDSVVKIGDQLVTVVSSNAQKETIAGLSTPESPDQVGEGQEYDSSTMTEKYVTADNKKYGRIIDVTEEMIYFDKTGQVLIRARGVGEKLAQYREKLIIEGIQDVNTNVWNPSGVATALYSTANGNLVSTNPFGESGLEEVLKKAQLMKDDSLGADDADYVYIDMNNLVVLGPSDLQVEMWQMANSVKTPESAENAENYFKNRFMPLSSPYVTKQSSTTWYWGNFKRDFWWMEVWPLQTIAQRPGHDDEFKRDIKARMKCRFYGAITAVDYKHVYKNTAA